MLVKQTHVEPRETIEFKFTKSKETFSFKPSLLLRPDFTWMIGLTNLQAYTFFFNITKENNKLDLYTDNSANFHLVI